MSLGNGQNENEGMQSPAIENVSSQYLQCDGFELHLREEPGFVEVVSLFLLLRVP